MKKEMHVWLDKVKMKRIVESKGKIDNKKVYENIERVREYCFDEFNLNKK